MYSLPYSHSWKLGWFFGGKAMVVYHFISWLWQFSHLASLFPKSFLKNFKVSSTTFLSFLAVPPSVSPQPSDGKFVVRKGSTITLECEARGNPMPVITWQRAVSKTISEYFTFISLLFLWEIGRNVFILKIKGSDKVQIKHFFKTSFLLLMLFNTFRNLFLPMRTNPYVFSDLARFSFDVSLLFLNHTRNRFLSFSFTPAVAISTPSSSLPHIAKEKGGDAFVSLLPFFPQYVHSILFVFFRATDSEESSFPHYG